jgi:hypothetical protein
MNKKVLNFVFICCATVFFGSCQHNKSSVFNDMYQKYIKQYTKEYTSHFPKSIPEKGVSFDGPLPAGAYALHYWGFQLLINYEDDKQKDGYLEEAQDELTNKISVSGNFVFLTNMNDYCDSVEDSANYSVYPFPNVQKEVSIINEIGYNIQYSKDWNDYKFYLIEQKDTIMYDEQKTNSCQLLEQKLGHGYSRGVVINEKDKILFFWLYFW